MTDAYLSLSPRRRRALLERTLAERGNVCAVCGTRVRADELSLEHIVPRSRGGDETSENLTISHKRCNSARGNRELDGAAGTIHSGLDWMIANAN